MKGKKFFQLLSDLDTPERRQLFHLCKNSNDKRHQFLAKILKWNPADEEELNLQFQQLKQQYFYNKTGGENDRIIRRLIDFFCFEIEALKIREYLRGNEKMYAFILTQIYLKKNFPYIFKYYSDWLFDAAEKDRDSYLQAACLEMKISFIGKTQKSHELKEINRLAIEKYQMVRKYYHQKQAEYYNVLSGLFLDDVHSLGKNMPTDAEFDALVSLSSGLIYSAVYRIAQARFHYDSVAEFLNYTGESKQLLKKYPENNLEKEKVTRRLFYLQMEVGFHLGFSIEVLRKYSREVNRRNELLGYPDSVGFFFHLFFLVLDNKKKMAEQLLKKNAALYFNNENGFYKTFIMAYISFRSGKITESQQAFHELAYSGNHYISLWSKLIEIIIHFKKGNYSFCKTLIERAERFLNKNSGKPFTRQASQILLNECKMALIKKAPAIKKQPPKFSPFHSHLLKMVRSST